MALEISMRMLYHLANSSFCRSSSTSSAMRMIKYHPTGGAIRSASLLVQIFKEHRTSAIRNMRETYQNAKQILAFDREVMSASVQASAVKLYIRLKLSSWARRLWTPQVSQVSVAPVI